MLIYFVRHGQSEGNRKEIHHTPDIPLSKDGVIQAKAIAKRLVNLNFDLIYASSMTRASQTAEIINEKLKLPIEYWDEIAECKSPSEIRGKKIDDPEVIKIKKMVAKNFYKKNWKYSDEETFDDLNCRASNVLDHLMKNHSDQTVLCISHSQFIKFIAAKIIFGGNLTPKIFSEMRNHLFMENTGITIYEHSEKYGWTLNTWSDTTHLR